MPIQGSFLPILLLLAPDPAPAQESESPAPPRVVITGSNIPTAEEEGPAPVIRVGRAEIERSGAATLREVIARLPQQQGAFSEFTNGGNTAAPGTSAVVLRGLTNGTLTLLNGRRVASFAVAQNTTDTFVDLNSIPLAAVERVEVLTDGASAIYGSDAIVGVVNVILRENYEGAEISFRYGNQLRNSNRATSDIGETAAALLAGFKTPRASVLVSLSSYHRNGSLNADNPFARDANQNAQGGTNFRSSATEYLAFLNPSDGVNYYTPPGTTRTLTSLAQYSTTPARDNFYNFNRAATSVPESDRFGAFVRATFELGKHVTAFAELGYQRNENRQQLAPTPLFASTVGAVIPATNPFNFTGQDIQEFRFRFAEVGPRLYEQATEVVRLLGGLRGDLGRDWRWETAFLYNTSDTDTVSRNQITAASVQAALNDRNPTTALNLFGGPNNPATLRALSSTTLQRSRSLLQLMDGKITGLPLRLPGGSVGLAIGGEWRHERLSDRPDDLFITGSIIGAGGSSGRGRRDVSAAFGELIVPVLGPGFNFPGTHSLEVQVAGRYERYSDFGGTFKPKFALAWRPAEWLLLRGSYAESFRAPSLPELFSAVSRLNPFGLTDTRRFAVTGAEEDNGASQYTVTTGGNPQLTSQNAISYFAGLVLTPPFAPGLTIGVDAYRIEYRNIVSAISAQTILDREAEEAASGTAGFYSNLVTRGPNETLPDGRVIAGRIVSIRASFLNLARTQLEGMDFKLDYRLPTRVGNFQFRALASWLHSAKSAGQPGDPLSEGAGGFATPKWRAFGSLTYENGGFGATTALNYTEGYRDQGGIRRRVQHAATVDFQLSYEFKPPPAADPKSAAPRPVVARPGWRRWLDGTKFTLGATNLLDEDPPFSNVLDGYDTNTGDPRGRMVYVGVTKKF